MRSIDRSEAGAEISRIVECLRAGGVVLLPTDTIYGLAIHPQSPEDTRTRLFAMKNRPKTRNLPILVSSTHDIASIGAVLNDPAERLMAAFSPGPLTVALGLDQGKAPSWLAGRVEVGVRIPADERLLAVLAMTGPLLVTSANLHAQETPESVESVLSVLDGPPDLVIDGGVRPTVPSTLVNCNLPTPVIEREGVISWEQIEKVLSSPGIAGA
jgi:L-threonylcarbamoyladenylate synthase